MLRDDEPSPDESGSYAEKVGLTNLMNNLGSRVFTLQTIPLYQAILAAPFGVLGIRCSVDALTGIEFLAPETAPCAPDNAIEKMVCEQLSAYLDNPDFQFTLPLKLNGTAHQTKVWQAICAIPRGKTRSYGELAKDLQSCAQAVGQACGANPIPIVIPCHRVVGKAGLGGFMHHSGGYALDIKRWLLVHEKR